MSSPQKSTDTGRLSYVNSQSTKIQIPVIISQAQNHECLSIHPVSSFYIFTEFYKSLETSLLYNLSGLLQTVLF